jgi:hypothetical protein
MAIDAILATIVDGGRAIVVIYREGVEINHFLQYFIDSTKTLYVGSWGWGMLVHQSHAAGEENGSIMVLAKSLPSGSLLFPAGTDLGVKLLSDHEAH